MTREAEASGFSINVKKDASNDQLTRKTYMSIDLVLEIMCLQ